MEKDDKTPRTAEVEAKPEAGSLTPKGTVEPGKTPGNAQSDAQPDKPVRNDESQKA